MPIQGLGGTSLPKKKSPLPFKKPKGYNPYAYVPGGASPAVAEAIQAKGLQGPAYAVPQVAIPGAVPQTIRRTTTTTSPSANLQNYMGEITSDPNYSLAQEQMAKALQLGQENLIKTPFRQALMQYGYDPRSFMGELSPDVQQFVGQYLDEPTLAAAAANPLSTKAQISKTFADALADLPYQLAGRGALRSGASTVLGGKIGQAQQLQNQQALQAFQQALTGNVLNYRDLEAAENARFLQAKESIASRLAQMAGYSEPVTTTIEEILGGDGGGGGGGGGTLGGVPASQVYKKPSGSIPNMKNAIVKAAIANTKKKKQQKKRIGP